MRLRFVDADDEREAAFLAALALGPGAFLVDGGADAEGSFASLLGESDARPPPEPADIAEAVLHFHDAPAALIQQVLRRRRPDAAALLAAGLKSALKFGRLPDAARSRLMLIGPPAAGKTTMMAKLAARGRAPLATVLSTDGERPGGIAQLADPMSVLGIEPESLDAAAETHPEIAGPLLVDTAGSAADDGFQIVGRLARALGVEPVLVLPATIDAAEAGKFAAAALDIGAGKLLITRLDMARRLSGPLAAAAAGLTLVGGSVTPNFAYGLKALGPGALAGHLLKLAQRRAAGLIAVEA